MKRLLMALTIAALGLAFSGRAQAFTQTTTGNINVTTTVLAACTVATTPLSFGNYTNFGSLYSTATITVNCSSAVPYRIDIDTGQNSQLSQRRRVKTGLNLAGPLNSFDYWLYKASTYNSADLWGDNGATYCPSCIPIPTGMTGNGTGANQVHTVYGKLTRNTNNTNLGAHSDTLLVTVNY